MTTSLTRFLQLKKFNDSSSTTRWTETESEIQKTLDTLAERGGAEVEEAEAVKNQSLSSFEASCSGSCGALASFYVLTGDNLTYISQLLDASISDIRNYSNIPNADSIQNGTRVKVPFSCDCLSTPNGNFFGHMFEHQIVQGDTYIKISSTIYRNLTTVDALRLFNNYPENNVPVNSPVNVTVNCSCGKSSVSRDYGFFLTYPIRPEDSLASIVSSLGSAPAELVQRYNPNVNFSSGTGIAFIPVKDLTGSYRPLKSRKSKVKKAALLPQDPKEDSIQHIRGNAVAVDRTTESTALVGSRSSGLTGITMDKSVEFSYEELSKATNDFNIANKIGEGGFGSVYYAELRGEKAAIKKMGMRATREFLAELKVLTHVHHLNLEIFTLYVIITEEVASRVFIYSLAEGLASLAIFTRGVEMLGAGNSSCFFGQLLLRI
ncbi:hypothetical protein ACLOJK_035539 [Asimina triloba]